MKRLLLASLLVLPAMAQEAPDKPREPEPADVMHEVRLRSGTLLVGKVEPRQWRVLTKFGTLHVPAENIRHVVFGRKAQPERFAQVRALIADLAASNPERRHHAQAKLKHEGAFAAPELHRAAKRHADPEVRRFCQEIFDAIGIDPDDFIPDEDRVRTSLFSVSGAVTLKSFKVTVAELGSLNVDRNDIIDVRGYSRTRVRKFKVTGQFTMIGTWLDTKIEMSENVPLKISAQGQIHFPRWGNQMMTPDGNPNMGNVNGIWLGTLIGKVGKTGQHFKIGRSYTGTPKGKGTLHIAVMMNQRNQQSSGEYTVRIERE